MYMVQIAHTGIDQRLERRKPNALEYPRPEQTLVAAVVRATPCRAKDHDDSTNDVAVPLAPDARRGDEQETGQAHTEKVVPSQERHVGQRATKVHEEGHGVGSKQGTERRRDDGEQGQDAEDAIAFPEGPILATVSCAQLPFSFCISFALR